MNIQVGDLWLVYGKPVIVLSSRKTKNQSDYIGLSLVDKMKYSFSEYDFRNYGELVARTNHD